MSELAKHGLKFRMNNGEPVLEDIIPFNPGAAIQQASKMCLEGRTQDAVPIFQLAMEYPEARNVASIHR